MCLYNQLFPLKTLTHITSNSLHTVRPKAITHSLDEVGGEFFYMECHEVIANAADNRSRDFEFIQNRARIIEFYLDGSDEFTRIGCRWQAIKGWENLEHSASDNTTSLPDAEDFAEIDAPLKFFFRCDDEIEALKVGTEIDERKCIVEKLSRKWIIDCLSLCSYSRK